MNTNHSRTALFFLEIHIAHFTNDHSSLKPIRYKEYAKGRTTQYTTKLFLPTCIKDKVAGFPTGRPPVSINKTNDDKHNIQTDGINMQHTDISQ